MKPSGIFVVIGQELNDEARELINRLVDGLSHDQALDLLDVFTTDSAMNEADSEGIVIGSCQAWLINRLVFKVDPDSGTVEAVTLN